MTKKLIQFSRTRSDLLFSFGNTLIDGIQIRLDPNDEFTPEDGVVFTEHEGFDFRNSINAELGLAFSSEMINQELPDFELEDLQLRATIEDTRLGIREVLVSLHLSEVLDQFTKVKIDLSSFDPYYFSGGFEIRCFIHRLKDDPSEHGPWSRSHVILQKIFVVKASEEDALFDINWVELEDPSERRDVWYYLNWTSTEVSEAPGAELFAVTANLDLRNQFKRLEANRQFGHLSIRQMAADILNEIVLVTLENADLSSEAAAESLHEQIDGLLSEVSADFTQLASDLQRASSLEKRQITAQVKRISHRVFGVGSQLLDTKFGGFRAI